MQHGSIRCIRPLMQAVQHRPWPKWQLLSSLSGVWPQRHRAIHCITSPITSSIGSPGNLNKAGPCCHGSLTFDPAFVLTWKYLSWLPNRQHLVPEPPRLPTDLFLHTWRHSSMTKEELNDLVTACHQVPALSEIHSIHWKNWLIKWLTTLEDEQN